MPRRYFIVLILTALTGLAALGLGYVLQDRVQLSVQSGGSAPNIKPFALTDQNGRAVTDETYRGRWLLVFFGFTRCPDICPMSMIQAADVLKALGPAADGVEVVFVSVDPERDTPEALKDYLANFDPRIIGLTGTPAQIAAIAKGYGVYYTQRKLEGQDDDTQDDNTHDNYTMDHSTAFYLVGPDGGLRRAYNPQRGTDALIADIRSAISPKE